MSALLIELDPGLITIDEAQYPDRDRSYVYDHLLYLYGLVDRLPVIGIKADPTGIVATFGQKYLRIAWQLGRRRIVASVSSSSASEAVDVLLARPDVQRFDWRAAHTKELETPVVEQWHVFFFARPLHADVKDAFEKQLAGFFDNLATERFPGWQGGSGVAEIVFDDARNVARFRAWIPVADESWYSSYLERIRQFGLEHAPILSFQGRRFEYE